VKNPELILRIISDSLERFAAETIIPFSQQQSADGLAEAFLRRLSETEKDD
jgi:hypothetical protein